ncbi:LAQU0S10e01684g1_1 [Lachancea quebecensis]|uniref:LAQU0S10e01684g1_1 n=1 Tax=Lachancea quebecensis TaxID=1654605 RepID=A0A0P1KW53_9SACH|nr:LAQU0S10e01684g1_1 [Lachancea quebecensis]
MQATQNLSNGSLRGEGLVDRIFDGLKHGGPSWTRHYGKDEISRDTGAPRLLRSGNLKRSLRKAKSVWDGSRFGSSRQNRKKAGSERPLNHLHIFSEGLQSPQYWDSERSNELDGAIISNTDAPAASLQTGFNPKSDEDKENFQKQFAPPGNPTVPHIPLQPLPIDLRQYLTGYEATGENAELFTESPALGSVTTPLKTAFSTLVSDMLCENRKWVKELAASRRQKPWKVSQKCKMEDSGFMEFLERLENLLKFESAFIEELHLRQDALHEENTLLRHQLMAVDTIELEHHKLTPCATSTSV